MRLVPSEREGLRKLQCNLCGSSDYARVTCILMLDSGYSPSAISLIVWELTFLQFTAIVPLIFMVVQASCWRTVIRAIGICGYFRLVRPPIN